MQFYIDNTLLSELQVLNIRYSTNKEHIQLKPIPMYQTHHNTAMPSLRSSVGIRRTEMITTSNL